jgi:hypothetical protein
MWELQRNGGDVQAVVERVLGGRGLETVRTYLVIKSNCTKILTGTPQPPPSFQPPLPEEPTPAPTATQTKKEEKKGPDLIERYGLVDKTDTTLESTEKTKAGWSASKTERQTLLQKRREEMILAARRKLMEENKQKEGRS